MNMRWFILVCVVHCIQFTTGSPPSSPVNVHAVYRNSSFIITWDVPPLTYGTITEYVLYAIILPETRQTIYRSDIPMIIIDAASHTDKMFRITVAAENKDGLSEPSKPFYIRSPCGRKRTIKPGSRVNISSPDFSNHVEKGVQCQWEIDTNYTHVLQFHFLHIDLGEDSDPTANACSDSFISVTSEGNSHEKICRERSDFVGSSMEKVSYFSGIKNNNNTGFRILISTKVKAPGPPTNITMTSFRTGVFIRWSPPSGRYLPLTSYTLRYRLSNYRREIVLSSRTPWFSIDTRNFRGQLLLISIYANISNIKGRETRDLYFRAPCHEIYRLPESRELQIVSPGYPSSYSPGVSCTWEIENVDSCNITITVVSIDIEDTLSCSGDYLSISVGGSSRLCGVTDRPSTINTKENNVKIAFVSDYKNQGRGFMIKVKKHAVQSTITPMKTSMTTTKTPMSKYTITSTDFRSITTHGRSYSPTIVVTNNVVTEATDNIPSHTNTPGAQTTESVKGSADLVSGTSDSSTTNVHSSYSTVASFKTILFTGELFRNLSYTTQVPISLLKPSNHMSFKDNDKPVSSSSSSSSIHIKKSSTSSTTVPSTIVPIFNMLSSPSLSTASISMASHMPEQTPTQISSSSHNSPSEINERSMENAVHNVSLNLEFMNRKRKRRISISNNTLLSLHDKLYHVFNNPFGILVDLELKLTEIEHRSVNVLLILMYSVPKLLIQMKMDTNFRLIKFINETVFANISNECISSGNWKLNFVKFSQFRTMKTFYNQEITSPCKLVSGYCNNDTACTIDKSAQFGIICLRKTFTNDSSIKPKVLNHDMTYVIVGSSVAAAVIIILVLVFILRQKCPRRHIRVTASSNIGQQPFNDILLHSRYIGDKNVVFTAFSSNDLKNYRKKRKGIISSSLPTKSIKGYDRNGATIEDKLKQLRFIEDQRELKKRLKVKYCSRRTNSL
ncbi:uncharacterized protein LOC125683791 isoform X2 [Ostrea edulis]|uniref:uncharacterized protein LOC125683791 isoform X2 n=1 Tax=Ostrea edulis TaxID=37623 RepID=UPI0024AF554A|nr:uncharacterized protein LOC125683791 isoform X2 [Ostrea edulis]